MHSCHPDQSQLAIDDVNNNLSFCLCFSFPVSFYCIFPSYRAASFSLILSLSLKQLFRHYLKCSSIGKSISYTSPHSLLSFICCVFSFLWPLAAFSLFFHSNCFSSKMLLLFMCSVLHTLAHLFLPISLSPSACTVNQLGCSFDLQSCWSVMPKCWTCRFSSSQQPFSHTWAHCESLTLSFLACLTAVAFRGRSVSFQM